MTLPLVATCSKTTMYLGWSLTLQHPCTTISSPHLHPHNLCCLPAATLRVYGSTTRSVTWSLLVFWWKSSVSDTSLTCDRPLAADASKYLFPVHHVDDHGGLRITPGRSRCWVKAHLLNTHTHTYNLFMIRLHINEDNRMLVVWPSSALPLEVSPWGLVWPCSRAWVHSRGGKSPRFECGRESNSSCRVLS